MPFDFLYLVVGELNLIYPFGGKTSCQERKKRREKLLFLPIYVVRLIVIKLTRLGLRAAMLIKRSS